MPRSLMLLSMTVGLFVFFTLPGIAQQSDPSPIGNTTVTLYYYNAANGTRGDVVPMPDNPQYVNIDPAVAAPGMYTFAHVPSAQWYYLEADHGGNKWYSIFYMEDGAGTETANVHIPPLAPVNATISPSTLTATPVPLTSTPAPSSTPVPTPGMTLPAAGAIFISLAMLRACGRK